MFVLNPYLDYKVKIKIYEHEVFVFVDLMTNYRNMLQLKNEFFYSLIDAVWIGYELTESLRKKYEMRKAKSEIELKPMDVKPYKITLNKFQIIWLYNISKGIKGLEDLRTNRLGLYIIADIPKENDTKAHI